ncbi:unnamed protein product [Musa banksii]
MQANGVNAAPATDRRAPAPSDAKGKHRISAELKRLEQEARFLENNRIYKHILGPLVRRTSRYARLQMLGILVLTERESNRLFYCLKHDSRRKIHWKSFFLFYIKCKFLMRFG